ncbi:MAG: carbon-nitrogen hydrolase family protein [Candidatus Omnitrophota bacterium]
MGVNNLKIALIQMKAGVNKEKNLCRAENFAREAAAQGARLILFPECFSFRGKTPLETIQKKVAETLKGPTVRLFEGVAKETKTFIVLGSIYEKIPSENKVYNTAVFISPDGKRVGQYRKKNLFSACLNTKTICEGNVFLPGKKGRMFCIDGGFRIGIGICFDLRFPEMFRTYFKKGCDIIILPSNFTYETGKDHWEVLLRARAIENKCYLAAPNQVGRDNNHVRSYGNSMVIDPWGRILARADDKKETIVFASLNKKATERARGKLG